MRLYREDIHAIEQPVELAARELDHLCVDIPRPRETILLELLLPEHEAVALPEQELYVIAPAIAEGEEVCAEGIELELFLNEHR